MYKDLGGYPSLNNFLCKILLMLGFLGEILMDDSGLSSLKENS
jgi:hypothetical protein